ncbi:hypothetical protein AYJ08_00920 [Brevibacillus sp. SKDU10]|uniref:restriction endonuclease subunit S n=1 Tax=Brevibacillus sp. SKDU10 TaxID=1247872 RepID=UPI0007C89878|nr:restriction endonuclease subunit S [Brevibacillus sp. SKDU10]OAJ73365.1 hypothetical protein AYJ08_00920 [Brevibacillus sp. SKDU10]
MARGMKQSLSTEQILEQVWVAEDEQPYEVPANWIWVQLGQVSTFLNGRAYKQDELLEQGKTPVLRVGNLFTNNSWYYSDLDLDENKYCDNNDLLFAWSASFGPFIWKGQKVIYHYHIWKVIPSRLTCRDYLYYWLTAETDRIKISGHGSGLQHITKRKMELSAIPLPPLTEQQRIVDRIEGLFANLDQAKELAQNALDSFETRKAAILHKAFTGELTAKWREEHGVSMDSWVDKELGDVCTSLQYGTSKKSSNEGKVVVIRMGNLQDGEIDWNKLAYSNDEEDIGKYLLQPGDVLFNRTNSPELVGKTSIYRGEYPAIFAGYIIRLKYDNQINGEYLNYVMNSVRAKEYCNAVKSDGVNQSNINAKKIAAFTLPVPSLEEQQEIVRILNRLFDSEKYANGIIDVIDKIEQMKKAILARAFRGELGTNDPSEENALELLKTVVVTQ